MRESISRIVESEPVLVVILAAAIVLSVVVVECGQVRADPEPISAALAASEYPTPTFDELHEQYARVCANESGLLSIPDQDGILQSLLHGGGGRKVGRRRRGQGYGLDYALLMRQMLRHSKRTFPLDSRFLVVTAARREWIVSNRTRLNRWTSTLRLDCSEPAGWPVYKLDGVTPMLPWRLFRDRCQRFVRSTREMLRGRMRSHCTGRPTTWGSLHDITKKDGALERGWTEIFCDRPPDTPETCDRLRTGGAETRTELWNSRTCARNTFWTWLKSTPGVLARRR